jgi:hypothetical protein
LQAYLLAVGGLLVKGQLRGNHLATIVGVLNGGLLAGLDLSGGECKGRGRNGIVRL